MRTHTVTMKELSSRRAAHRGGHRFAKEVANGVFGKYLQVETTSSQTLCIAFPKSAHTHTYTLTQTHFDLLTSLGRIFLSHTHT